MPSDLAAYARTEARKSAGGASCCAAFVAGWIDHRVGRDAAAIFDGLDDATVEALLDHPGLLRAARAACRAIGLRWCREPVAGDVGVILFAGRLRCAIRSEHGWLHRDEAGVCFTSAGAARQIAAWRVA